VPYFRLESKRLGGVSNDEYEDSEMQRIAKLKHETREYLNSVLDSTYL